LLQSFPDLYVIVEESGGPPLGYAHLPQILDNSILERIILKLGFGGERRAEMHYTTEVEGTSD
jgi:hypothetical protein